MLARSADGTGNATPVYSNSRPISPSSVSSDGKYLTYSELTNGWDVGLYSFEEGTAKPFLNTGFTEAEASISPNGKWMVYASDETEALEVYVRPFPEIDTEKWLAYISDELGRPQIFVQQYPGLDGKWQISTGSTGAPHFAANPPGHCK